MKRMKVNQKRSKKYFTATARKVEVKNVAPPPMRGGIRL